MKHGATNGAKISKDFKKNSKHVLLTTKGLIEIQLPLPAGLGCFLQCSPDLQKDTDEVWQFECNSFRKIWHVKDKSGHVDLWVLRAWIRNFQRSHISIPFLGTYQLQQPKLQNFAVQLTLMHLVANLFPSSSYMMHEQWLHLQVCTCHLHFLRPDRIPDIIRNKIRPYELS